MEDYVVLFVRPNYFSAFYFKGCPNRLGLKAGPKGDSDLIYPSLTSFTSLCRKHSRQALSTLSKSSARV